MPQTTKNAVGMAVASGGQFNFDYSGGNGSGQPGSKQARGIPTSQHLNELAIKDNVTGVLAQGKQN